MTVAHSFLSNMSLPVFFRYVCTLLVMHCDDVCYIGLSNSVVSGITLSVSVFITSVITVIISKGGYSLSPTDFPALYEIPVSTKGVSSLEMKDNMAYGHVTIDSGYIYIYTHYISCL